MRGTKTETVIFGSKGRVVIPQRLRRDFEIEEGTRALIYMDGDSIILKPMTSKRYDKLQGCLKGRGVLKAVMEDRKREREL